MKKEKLIEEIKKKIEQEEDASGNRLKHAEQLVKDAREIRKKK
jgi:t-SNARE complex subunit (syntaxin)